MFEFHPVQPLIRVKAVVTAFEAKYNKTFHFPGENHDFWEMVYVIEGRVGITADERVHELGCGEIVFHKPMEYHRIWSACSTKPRVFIVSFVAEGEKLSALKDGIFSLDSESIRLIDELIEQIRLFRNPSALFPPSLAQDPQQFQCFCNTLELFLLSVSKTQKDVSTSLTAKDALVYKQAVEIMKQNLSRDLSVEDIADLCHISPSYLKKIFNKYSACGVHKYFLNLKILMAASLLTQGHSAKEVSRQLGFNNQNYFSTVFKRETGFSPKEYIKHKTPLTL